MEKYKQKSIWWLELIAKLGILTVGFLEASSLTFGKPVISLVLWPTVFLGGILLLVRLVHWREYWRSVNFFLLLAFCVSYLVSMALNVKYGWYTNLRTLIWMAFLMFLLYCYREREPLEREGKQFRILTVYYLIGNAVLSVLSFCFLFTGYSKIFYQEVGPIYYIGFHWGRLYGAYWDANIGAVMSCIAVFLSVGLFRTRKALWVRVLTVLNIVLEVCYIAFSDSRTGRLCLCVGIPVYVFLAVAKNRKAVAAAVCAAFAFAAAFAAPAAVKNIYNAAALAESKAEAVDVAGEKEEGESEEYESLADSEEDGSSMHTMHKKDPEELQQEQGSDTQPDMLGREEEYAGDITTRRADIWKSALEIFQTRPVAGVSHNNVLAYVYDQLPDSYLITNDHMDFDSMHNTFLDILVGQGLIGLVIYLAMAVLFFMTLVKNRKRIGERAGAMALSQFAVLLVLVTASCVMTEIVYVTSPMSAMFWMSMGGLMQASAGPSKEKGEV